MAVILYYAEPMSAGELYPREPSIDELLIERMRDWSDFFAVSPLEEANEYSDQATEELDSLWEQTGLMNEICVVNGYGSWSEFVPYSKERAAAEDVLMSLPRHNKILIERLGQVSMRKGKSQGFRFGQMMGADKPTMHHQFLTDRTAAQLGVTYSHGGAQYLQITAGTLRATPLSVFQGLLEAGADKNAIRN